MSFSVPMKRAEIVDTPTDLKQKTSVILQKFYEDFKLGETLPDGPEWVGLLVHCSTDEDIEPKTWEELEDGDPEMRPIRKN